MLSKGPTVCGFNVNSFLSVLGGLTNLFLARMKVVLSEVQLYQINNVYLILDVLECSCLNFMKMQRWQLQNFIVQTF